MNAPYLSVSIRDNDYTSYYDLLGGCLNKLFKYSCKYPTKEDFPWLEKYIQHLWWSIDNLIHILRWKDCEESRLEDFKPYLDIIDYIDIPEWNNNETIYVPLFDESDEFFIK